MLATIRKLLFGSLTVLLGIQTACGQESASNDLDPAPITSAVQAYATAFNQQNAAALAGFWTPDAVYTNMLTGEVVRGRAAIENQFKTLFAESPKLRMELTSDAIQFLSPHVAIEHGTARLLRPEEEPEVYQYEAVYIRQNDQWLLDRVRDEEGQAAPYYSHLKQLEWMVGTWSSQQEDVRVHLDCQWTTNRSFLIRRFSIEYSDDSFSGVQFVGYDPVQKTIRCWTFDQSGAFGEGTWNQQGDAWILKNVGTMQDGSKTAMINVMRTVDDSTFTWKTIDRFAAGRMLPNLPEITLVRDATP
jgi:uncharacterized protein (TIGR02246 family)